MCFGNKYANVPLQRNGAPTSDVMTAVGGRITPPDEQTGMQRSGNVLGPAGPGYDYTRENFFRHPFDEGGDMTLATDIPGNWSAKNVLPGTDPGMAGWHENSAQLVQMLLDALTQQRGATKPSPLSGGKV